jgi:hypothetical protein
MQFDRVNVATVAVALLVALAVVALWAEAYDRNSLRRQLDRIEACKRAEPSQVLACLKVNG